MLETFCLNRLFGAGQPNPPMPTTEDRILDAAERLFARQGIGATSLRAITAEAGVNTAAIHYHFGSKPALLEAVLARRIAPLDQDRLKRLEQLELAAGDGPVPPRALLEAFLAPVVAMRAELGDHVPLLGSLMAWLRIESEAGTEGIPKRHFAAVKRRFASAVCRGRDDLDLGEAMERLDYAVGAVGHVMVSEGFATSADTGVTMALFARLDRLVDFLAPGFAARGARNGRGGPR